MATQDNSVPGSGYGNPYLDSLIWGCGWTGSPITYYFAGSNNHPAAYDWFGYEKQAFTKAVQLYENVANIDFLEVGTIGQADMVEWLVDSSILDGFLGYHDVPDGTYDQAYGYYNIDYTSWTQPNLVQGGYGFVTLIHELGHALGLAHPYEGGSESDATTFPGVTYGDLFDLGDFELNQGIWTTMGVNDGWNVAPSPSLAYGWQGTPMAFDIAALQAIYGANMNYNTGANVYSLPKTNGSGTFWSCIWDAGGIDEITAAGAAGACTINLNDASLQQDDPNAGGFVSRVNGIIGGFTIANGVVIENATGGNGNDTLIGNEAANTLKGGGGADLMQGGQGDDIYVVDNGLDKVNETGGTGIDTVLSSLSFNLNAGTVLGDVENLTLTGTAAINGTGNDLANIITGNSAVNILSGGAGNDTLNGGAGADNLMGGANDDTYTVDALDKVDETGGTGVDTVKSAVSFNLSAATVLGDVENLTLTGTGVINGTGNSIANVITGNVAANKLDGMGGNDTLIGGAGNDTLIGGAGLDDLQGQDGSDTYFVGAGDTASETNGLAAGGIDLVSSDVDFTLGANLEHLTLTGTAIVGTGNTLANRLTGNGLANLLVGDLGNDTLLGGDGNDTLDGGAGSDSMVGGAGDDTYKVSVSTDVVSETLTGVAGGTDTVKSEVNYTLAANVENLVLIGALMGTGNALNNQLTGNSLDNTLNGGLGADTMLGGAGTDSYVVNDVKDQVDELNNGGAGTDTVQSSITFTLVKNGTTVLGDVENLTLTGTALINGTGNALANIITGNAAVNILIGDAGNDTLNGGLGADNLKGGAGDDTYVVDNALDKVDETGGDGTDTVLSSFSFNLSAATVLGAVENLTLTGTGAINGTGNAGDNVITGNGAANKLDGMDGNDTLIGGAGNDTLIGGVGFDDLQGQDGSDTYFVGAGDVATETNGSAAGGIDLVFSDSGFTLGANLENLTLTGTGVINGTGNALANIITGNSAVNILIGDAGNDTLNGGLGADNLKAGADNDTYVVDNALDTVDETGGSGTDTVQSSVTFDLSGAAALGAVENLTLTGATAINGTGNALANIITGNSAANILIGNAGSDMLNGGAGADSLIGGIGNDSYVIDNVGDKITDSDGTLDTVQSSVTLVLTAGLENLTLTGSGAINGTGNAVDNVITGNLAANKLDGKEGDDSLIGAAGNDTLTGGEGNDTLDGGSGSDSMVGGAGNDTYKVSVGTDLVSETLTGPAGGTDTVQSEVSYTLGANLENLVLIGAALTGAGNALNNQLTGNGLNNTLNGGVGADTMLGGAGNDIYVVDDGGDQVDELNNGGAGTDTVQSSITFSLVNSATLLGVIENLTLTGAALINGTGNDLANIITGNSAVNTLAGGAGNDTLNGSLGADSLVGGLGDDTYVVDNALDKINETGGDGTDTVKSSVSFNLGTAAVGDVENLTLTGAATINGTGNDLANIITGNAAVNILNGGAGDDTLNGGAGADSLVGGTGSDTYFVDNALDRINEVGGDGSDTVQSSVSFNLGAATVVGDVENLTLTGMGAINGTGNVLANLIVGNSAANTLTGNAGNDTLNGGLGNDTLTGGADNDSLNGEGGNDLITGGGGGDTVDVSVGNDTVRYTSTLDGHDVISGFDGDSLGGQDVLNLDALFDSLGIAAANRAARIELTDLGATVEVRVNTGGAPDFDLFVATLNTADAITVGQDIIAGS